MSANDLESSDYEEQLQSVQEPLRSKLLGREVTVEPSFVSVLRAHGFEKLAQAHAEELEPHMADRLDLNWDAYSAAQDHGQLIAFGAFTDDRVLVGYAIAVVVESLHYSDNKFVQMDGLYVMPEWRTCGVGLRLIKSVRALARVLGAEQLLIHARPNTSMEMLLLRMGFNVQGIMFEENL